MSDPHRLREITRIFPTFLGLRLLPAGFWFLLVPIPALGLFASPAHLALMVVAAAATWPIHLWYRRRYGRVEPERLRLGRGWALLTGLVAAYLALAMGAAAFGHHRLVLLLVVVLFLTAAALARPRPLAGGSRPALAFWGVAGLAALLLLWVTREPRQLAAAGDLFSLGVGVLLVLGGLIEHASLRRAFAGAPPAPAGEGEVV